MRNRTLVILPVLLGALLLLPQAAEAQYYRGGGYRGYGYGPPPAPDWSYRHRVHGYFGGQLTGIATVGQTLSPENNVGGYLGHGGGGGGLFGGVRLGPFFSLEASWNITWHQAAEGWDAYGVTYQWSSFTLQTAELDGKIHIPTRGPIEPYFQAGIGIAFLGVSWNNDWGYAGDYLLTSGVCFNVGGGLDIWLSPWFTLGGRILYKGMRFGSYDVAGASHGVDPNYASAVNVDLNAAIHF